MFLIYLFFPCELEFLNLYQPRYLSLDNFNQLMNWTQFFICGMTVAEYGDVFLLSDLDTFLLPKQSNTEFFREMNKWVEVMKNLNQEHGDA